MIAEVVENIEFTYFFLSALLFFAGMYLAPTAIEKNLDFLLRYPRWVQKLTKRFVNGDVNIFYLFILIFFLNNLLLISGFMSGLFVILPPIFAFMTGFNIATMSYDLLGWRGIWQILTNPIAWLEFPAACISFSFAHQIAEAQLTSGSWSQTMALVAELWPIYMKSVFVLLFFAAALEVVLIASNRRLSDNSNNQ